MDRFRPSTERCPGIIAVLLALLAGCYASDQKCPPGQSVWSCRVHVTPGPACGYACGGWEQDVSVCAFNSAHASNQIVAGAQRMVMTGYFKSVGVHQCWPGGPEHVPPNPGPMEWCDPTYDPSCSVGDQCTCDPW